MQGAVQTPPAPPGLAETFRLIIGGLCEAVARRIAADRTAGPFILLIVARLRRIARRFAALAARVQAGKLKPPRHRTPKPRPPRERPPGLPRSFGWLIRFVPYEAACFGSQLQHQFSQPEMMALLEVAPQAGRILRPLCRMLQIDLPPALRLPARPPRPPPIGEDGTVYEWRRWRDIWMPEPVRTPKPA
jgi:hypothetical protein